ncbi:MAG: HEAT repeat domain-containing protein, partial [Planctomycetota bacterium]
NPDADKMKDKLVYRTYPSYIYFLRQGVQVALEGLHVEPGDERLQTLLLTLQTVEMTRCELFSSEEYVTRFGAEEGSEETTETASELLSQLEEKWPLLAHSSTPRIVGLALEQTMEMGDSRSSLRLLKLLSSKPALSAQNGGNSLLKALDYGDKDVRYAAATAAVQHWPLGSPGQADKVVRVLTAALQQATAKTALLVFDDFGARNELSYVLRQKGVTTVGCRANPPEINSSLNLQPAVDAVFLTANVGQGKFQRVLESLKSDVRTGGVPIYVVVDSSTKSVQVPKDEDIKGTIKLGQVKSPDFESMVTSQLLQRSNTPLTEKKEQTVLRALEALLDVPPQATSYKLQELEPGLVRALRGYSEEVQDGALRALSRFGSPDAVLPVSKKLAQEGPSADLKAQACRTLASIFRRTGQQAPKKAVSRLRTMLEHDSADVRRAAAEALGAAGLSAEEVLDLQAEYSRLQPVGQ